MRTKKSVEGAALLNAQKVDGALISEENGKVSFRKAPWNDIEVIADKPKVIYGKLVCSGGDYGDMLDFYASQPSGKKVYTDIYKTLHGTLRTSEKRVFVSYSFPKEMAKEEIMKYLYKEVMSVKQYAKGMSEDQPWENYIKA